MAYSRDAKAMADTVRGAGRSNRGSFMEHRTRRERKFSLVESQLPDTRCRPSTSENRDGLVTDVLSYLGPWNPMPHEISKDDTVWLLDNTAYRDEGGQWQAEFVAATFDHKTGVEVAHVIASIAEKLGLAEGDEREQRVKQRLMPFLQEILPARVVRADFASQLNLKLGPGGRNGISSDAKVLPVFANGQVVPTVAKVPQGTNGILNMNTVFAEPRGWGVISDIDDTIKVTLTSDPIGILKSTFIDEATPIAGMPELYQYIQHMITPEAPFFYLSASPYNLYSFLSEFRQKYYPQGTMILRDASWMNLSGLLSSLTLGTKDYKVDRMQKINSWLPDRNMICIGDSTQSDPEAYGEIYNKFPGFVKLILIRKVTDIAAIGIAEKNEPKRFEKAFSGVPKNVWHVFEKPEDCYKLIQDVTLKR